MTRRPASDVYSRVDEERCFAQFTTRYGKYGNLKAKFYHLLEE